MAKEGAKWEAADAALVWRCKGTLWAGEEAADTTSMGRCRGVGRGWGVLMSAEAFASGRYVHRNQVCVLMTLRLQRCEPAITAPASR